MFPGNALVSDDPSDPLSFRCLFQFSPANELLVKLDEECYEKRLVTIGNSNGDEIEILSGLTRKDEVVTKGAIIVKLAESSGAVPEGHSHNH